MFRSSPLIPLYDAIDQRGSQLDSPLSPEVRQYPLYHVPPSRPSIRPTPSYSTMPHLCTTPPQRLPTPTTLSTANSISRSRTSLVQPSKNYKTDAHALNKIRSAPRRTMMVDQIKRLRRGKSDNVLHMRVSNHGNQDRGQDRG